MAAVPMAVPMAVPVRTACVYRREGRERKHSGNGDSAHGSAHDSAGSHSVNFIPTSSGPTSGCLLARRF